MYTFFVLGMQNDPLARTRAEPFGAIPNTADGDRSLRVNTLDWRCDVHGGPQATARVTRGFGSGAENQIPFEPFEIIERVFDDLLGV